MSEQTGLVNEGTDRVYRVISVVGKGGFGAVYKARLEGRGGFTKTVALKVLNAEMARQPDVGARLRDEARLLALLRHRSIVRVEDLVQVDSQWAEVQYTSGRLAMKHQSRLFESLANIRFLVRNTLNSEEA